ncbi:hypothetical protein EON83_22630 [bacterium]|nr:MAG: hypothetical protein EON83_22630 [bacterium]
MTQQLSFLRSLRQNTFVVLGLITLLGAVLRLFHLDYKPLWLDEAVLYWISKGNISDVIIQNATRNSAPPLFAVLLHLIIQVGDSESMLRSISCAAGIAAIPSMYFLARNFMPRGGAYLCAFVAAISQSQVIYSQQLREYSLSFFVACLLIAFFVRNIQKPNWKDGAMLSVMSAVAVFCQYGLSLLVFSLAIISLLNLAFNKEQNSDAKRLLFYQWVVNQLVALIAVFAVYSLSLKFQMQAGGFATSATSNYLAGAYWDGSPASLFRLVFRNTFRIFSFAYPPIWSLLPLFLLGLAINFKKRLPLQLLVVPLLCTFIAACLRKYPYDGARQIMFLLPMIYVFAGLGFTYLLSQKKGVIFATIAIAIVGVAGLKRTKDYLMVTGDEDIRPAVRLLTKSVKTDDVIYVYNGSVSAFSYYYRSPNGHRVYSKANRLNPQEYAKEVDALLPANRKIWLIFSHTYGQEREIVLNQLSAKRKVELVMQKKNSWLYVTR